MTEPSKTLDFELNIESGHTEVLHDATTKSGTVYNDCFVTDAIHKLSRQMVEWMSQFENGAECLKTSRTCETVRLE